MPHSNQPAFPLSTNPGAPGRQMAAHVQNAVATAMQAKVAASLPGGAPMAPHVRAAIAAGRRMGAQPQPAMKVGAVRPVAAHVQMAIAGTMRAKTMQAKVAVTRQMAPHVQRAVVSAAQAGIQPAAVREPAAHVRQAVASAPPPTLGEGAESVMAQRLGVAGASTAPARISAPIASAQVGAPPRRPGTGGPAVQTASGGKTTKTRSFSQLLAQGEHEVLVYGTEDARQAYRKKLKNLPSGFSVKKSGQPRGWATTGYYTVDRYSNYSWRDFEYKGTAKFSIFNPSYVKHLNKLYGKNREIIKKHITYDLELWTKREVKPPHLGHVLEFQRLLLEHPRWSPLTTVFESGRHCARKEGMPNAKTDEEFAKAKFQRQTRRASKFGIQYMSIKKKRVAFIREVGGVIGKPPTDSKFVTEKRKSVKRPGGRTAASRVPITVSEERMAYRNRRGRHVRFYLGGKPVEAPWVTDEKNWKEYGRRRIEKYTRLAKILGIDYPYRPINFLKGKVHATLRRIFPQLSASEAIAALREPLQKKRMLEKIELYKLKRTILKLEAKLEKLKRKMKLEKLKRKRFIRSKL